MGVGRDTLDEVPVKRRDEMIAARMPDFRRDGAALVKVLPGRHQFAAEGLHRRVLFARVAFGNHDNRRNAVADSGDGDGLAMIAAGRRDQPLRHLAGTPQGVDINQHATRLERSGRCVVLMLDDDLRAASAVKQRPAIGRRRGHESANYGYGGLKLVQREQRHDASPCLYRVPPSRNSATAETSPAARC